MTAPSGQLGRCGGCRSAARGGAASPAGGGSAGQYRGELEPSGSPVPVPETSRERKGQILHVCSGKRRDCERERAVEVRAGAPFAGHGPAAVPERSVRARIRFFLRLTLSVFCSPGKSLLLPWGF